MYHPVKHPRFTSIEAAIFTRPYVADCMQHACRQVYDGSHRHRNDVCCQYGADTDLAERDRILQKAEAIKTLMHPEAAAAPWFTDDVVAVAEFPTGQSVRTTVFDGGCVFLQHNGRGCALHRAALELGWELAPHKPHICQLYPVTYDDDAIMLSEDHADYSCAFDAEAPSVYRVQRASLAAVFGEALVAALDVAEAEVLAQQPKRLPVLP